MRGGASRVNLLFVDTTRAKIIYGKRGKEGCLREDNDKGDDCFMYDVTCIHGH
jgi:hypothetical protein